MSDDTLWIGLMFLGFAALVSYLIGFAVCWMLLRWGVVDRPNERSSHTRITARGGGVGILLIWMGLVAMRSFSLDAIVLLAGVAVLAAVSFVDDVRIVSARLRFGCHTLVSAGMLATLCRTGSLPELLPGSNAVACSLLALALGFLWLVGYINAFNFMDGINGLSASQAVITGLGMGILSGFATGNWGAPPVLFSFLLAGAALGFLPHNFPKARMFMGDVGSAPLGYILGTLVLWLAAELSWRLLVPLALLHTNFVLDTGLTLVRRMFRGERWYQAHREHFYQRLVRSGLSHAFVTGTQMALQVAVIGLVYLHLRDSAPGPYALIAMVAAIWLSYFLWAEFRFRRCNEATHSGGTR